MTFAEFHAKYRLRIRRYATRMQRVFSLNRDAIDDLEQAALLAAFKVLPYWKTDGGKAVFNWCATAMASEMYRTVRSLRGYRPYERGPMTKQFDSFEDRDGQGEGHDKFSAYAIEDVIDLRRALQSDPKPAEIVRFIMLALSPGSGGSIARDRGVSRQAIFYGAQRTRARLIAAMQQVS